MIEKQPTTFRQYLGKKFDIIISPILVSVFIMLFDVVIGLVILSFVVIMFVICYFVFGRNLVVFPRDDEIEYKEPEKWQDFLQIRENIEYWKRRRKEITPKQSGWELGLFLSKKKEKDLLIFKYYYNRVKVIKFLSVCFIGTIVILALTDFCFPCFTGSLIILVVGIVLLIFVNPRIIDIKIIESKDITDCFWLNRHHRNLEKLGKVKFKYGLLEILSLVIVFSSLFSLVLLAGEVYRGYSMSALLSMTLVVVTESIFSFTSGSEEVEKKEEEK